MILLKRKSTDVSPLNPLDSIKPVQSSTGPCPACRPAASLTSSPSLPAPLAQFPQVTRAHCSVAEPQALAPRFLGAPCCPGWVARSLPVDVGSAFHHGLCVILPKTPTSTMLSVPLLKELSQVSTGKQKSLKHLKQEGFNAGNQFLE